MRKQLKTIYLPNFCLDCGVSITYRSKRCGPCSRKGSNHYNWKGDKTNDINGRSRAERMYKGFTECSKCGKKGKIQRHHIDHNTSNNSSENIEILCMSCHRFAHTGRNFCKLCGKKVHARLLCNKHYRRLQRNNFK